MRMAWPSARIDVLVYMGKGGMLEGNSDCNEVIESDEHPDTFGYWRLLRRILNRYELAVSTQANDRGHLYAWLSARLRVGLVSSMGKDSLFKRMSCHRWAVMDNVLTHTVVQNLVLADRMSVQKCYSIIPPSAADAEEQLDRLLPFDWRQTPYATLHPYPMWQYKRWTNEGWRSVLAYLAATGKRVVITGGPENQERTACEALAASCPESAVSIAGGAGFGVLARLMKDAAVYVGPDTATTHLAAACGTRTIALYGPSNPVKWGPWPLGWSSDRSPWQMYSQPWQKAGNVLMLQGLGDCVPCREEGCEHHKNSNSNCLSNLANSRVIEALEHFCQ